MKRIALALLAFAAPSVATAQAPPADSTAAPTVQEVHASRLTEPVSIDGSLSEPVWQSATPVERFHQRDPVEGAEPTQRSEVRVAYDDEALYVGARLHDTAPDSIIARLTRRDVSISSDRFCVYLDPYYDRRSGFYFQLNAAGTLYDGTLYNDGWDDDSWDGVWEAKAKIDDHGWTAEMRIPYSQLRFPRVEVQRWGINFRRTIMRLNEEDYLVFQPKKESGFVSRFPTLVGLENLSPPRAIEVMPYATSKASFLQHDPLDPFNDGSQMEPNVGGDLRMALGSKLTLNATVNPDFGQVEVDPAVVNLSDVETFFPEKRPFFVEGSSIFDAGQQGASDYWGFNWPQPTFFYSRRVGRAPVGDVPDDAEFTDVPSGTTILGAGKVSGKFSPGLNFGTLHAFTAKEQADFQTSGGSQGAADVEPLTYFGVVRMLQEFKERQNGLGVLGTATVRRFDETGLDDQFNRTGFLTVMDGWHFLDKKQSWVLSGWAGGSYISGTEDQITSIQESSRHYFQRPDAKSYEVDPDATSLAGGGARVWLNKQKGSWISNSAIGFISPGFEVNDAGFSSRTDVINTHVGLGYKWTNTTKVRKYQNILGAVFGSMNFDGNITGAGVWVHGNTEFANNWSWDYGTAYNPETINARRSRGGPLMLNAPGYEFSMYFDTDGKRKRFYFVDTYQYWQPEEDSWYWNVYPGFEWKPASRFSLSIGPGYESSRDGAYYFTTLEDPAATATYGNRYIFARLDQETFSANLRLNIAFTPAVSLQFYGQPLVSSAKYTNLKELARPKSLDFLGPGAGAWTYDPVTNLFDPDGPGGPEDPYTNDFNFKSLRGNAVFRWEYMPGSAFYLVWTHERTHEDDSGQFALRNSLRTLAEAEGDNIFLAKLTYYFTP